MNNGNNQEGIGIYFTDNIETARSYGKNVVKTTINMNKFVHSRDIASDHIPKQRIIELLQILTNINQEDMFYYMSDYTELTKPTDIDYGTFDIVADYVLENEVRNLQIELAEVAGVLNFANAWNKVIDIDGTYAKQNDDEVWFAIINPSHNIVRIT